MLLNIRKAHCFESLGCNRVQSQICRDLRHTNLSADAQELVSQIESYTTIGQNMVLDLLEFNSEGNEQFNLEKTNLDFNLLIKSAIKVAQHYGKNK